MTRICDSGLFCPAPTPIKRGGSAFLIAAVIAALSVSSWVGLHYAQNHLSSAVQARLIAFDAATVGQGGTLLIGDSRVSQLHQWSLCGRPIVRAGYAGQGLTQIAAQASDLARFSRPRLVIISAGINDARRDRPFVAGRWASTATVLGKEFSDHGAKVVFASVVSPSTRGDYGVGYFDVGRIAAMNSALAQTGRFLDVRPALQEPGGFLKPSYTLDGTHYSAAGQRVWISAVSAQVCPHT